MIYEVGDLARLTVNFTDIAGVPADPTTVTLLVQAPDNSQTQYALPPIVHSATGQYYYDLSTTQSGTWFYRWTGAGALQVVVEGSLQVAVTELVPQVSPPGATAFTYNFATEPDISSVRLLCSDTTAPGIFQDAEVSAALYLESSQALYVSGQASPIANASQNPAIPQIYSYRRSAALLLDSIAAQLAQQGAVEQILDVKLSCVQASKEAAARAKALRDTEANSGNFAIAEMVVNQFAARERVYKQLLRLYGSS